MHPVQLVINTCNNFQHLCTVKAQIITAAISHEGQAGLLANANILWKTFGYSQAAATCTCRLFQMLYALGPELEGS